MTVAKDKAEFGLRLELPFADEESPEENRADVVEWGALGFLFVTGVLFFADARPRGASDMYCGERDQSRITDLVAALELRHGELHRDTNYVRGRRMKTMLRN